MNKKTRSESAEVENMNYKKKRMGEGGMNQMNQMNTSGDYSKRNDYNRNSTGRMGVPYSPFNQYQAEVRQNTSNPHIVNFYNEKRIASMSHIKQMNPKYKNLIIPVLPDALNKFN